MQIVEVKAIPTKGSGYADYATGIGYQQVGISNQPDWQTRLGNQKQIAVQATNLNTYTLDDIYDRYVATATYTVPAGVDFYIWIISAIMNYVTATSTYNWLVEIYDNTTGVRQFAYAGGGLGAQCNVQFARGQA